MPKWRRGFADFDRKKMCFCMLHLKGKVTLIMKKLLEKYKHAWCLLYAFIYLPWFMFLEQNVVHYHKIHSVLDDYIPFCEYFVIPYFLWFGYVAVTILYFFFTSKEDYFRTCTYLFTGMTISLIICTIWPNGHGLRPVVFERDNIFTQIVGTLYSTDTATNVFPSIHVFNSIGVHTALVNSERLKDKKWLHIGSAILMVSIICSTVFLKQHSILDVFGGIVLSMVMHHFVYRTEHSWGRESELEKQWN